MAALDRGPASAGTRLPSVPTVPADGGDAAHVLKPVADNVKQSAPREVDSQAKPSWVPTTQHLVSSSVAPVVLAARQDLSYQQVLSAPAHCLPVNCGTPFEFRTDGGFEGRACVYLRGVPNTPSYVFEGRKRRSLLVVQGRFLQPGNGFDDIITGQEFARSKNVPSAWLVDKVLKKVSHLTRKVELGTLARPYLLMPVVAGCNEIHVAMPGQEPDMRAPPREDMRLVGGALAQASGRPLPAESRRAFFGRQENRAGRTFATDMVWTFYFYQHLLDLPKYSLNLLHKFDLARYLDGQPLQLMMKDRRSSRYLYCFDIWHERLLEDARRHSAQRAGALP